MAAKRPAIVVVGNTPSKLENKKQSTEDALREACSKKEILQQRLLEGKNGWKLKHLLSCQYICLFWDDAGHLQTADCRLQTTDYKLHKVDLRP